MNTKPTTTYMSRANQKMTPVSTMKQGATAHLVQKQKTTHLYKQAAFVLQKLAMPSAKSPTVIDNGQSENDSTMKQGATAHLAQKQNIITSKQLSKT